MDLGLAGKVAIVTGSSRGIGRGIATRLAEEGANVVLCARGGDELDAAVRSIAGPGRAIGIVADVATPEGAAAVVAAAVDQLGGVDIVVNNVGGSGAKTFAEMDAADLQAVLDKNLFPAVNVSRAALPSLRARGGGVIAMISSIWGREGGGAPSYNIAKAAEISLAKAMATDLAKDGVRVFSVAPGSTLFPGGSWERRTRDDPEGIAAFIERELPFGRLGTVDEIADVVTFMVSPRASWVVGTCITVDGGQSRVVLGATAPCGQRMARRRRKARNPTSRLPSIPWDLQAAPSSRSRSACAPRRRRGCLRSRCSRSRHGAGSCRRSRARSARRFSATATASSTRSRSGG